MYEHPDQTWKSMPGKMSPQVGHLTGKRIAEYKANRDPNAGTLVVLHGGEPLLVGTKRLDSLVATISKEIDGLPVSFGLQTNGVLLNDEWLTVFRRRNIRPGVSLDGPGIANSLRKDKSGKDSTGATERGIRLLANPPDGGGSLLGGVLAVANPSIKPQTLLDYFSSLGVKAVDFLLPDLNWDTRGQHAPGELADWWCELYRVWTGDFPSLTIRTFAHILRMLAGGTGGFDAFGSKSRGVLVIETDGTYHRLDCLKTAYDGVTATGLDLVANSIEEAETDWSVRALTLKESAASQTCLNCDVFAVCGGGYLPHRFSKANGFDNPSVYCRELKQLIDTIADDLESVLVQAGSMVR
jgi:uncharacterized protein